MNSEKIYNVKNRSSSMVVYSVPELGARREFAPGETKKIPFIELEKLSYQGGGRALMANFLQIQSEEAIQNLSIPTEPEYNMTEQEIVDLLKNGSLDAFLDCLDFAPIGVIDLIKQFAVALPLTDSTKREALKNKTGFDVTRAIENSKEDVNDQIQPAAPTRRVKTEEKVAPTRRTSTNYKVVSPKE